MSGRIERKTQLISQQTTLNSHNKSVHRQTAASAQQSTQSFETMSTGGRNLKQSGLFHLHWSLEKTSSTFFWWQLAHHKENITSWGKECVWNELNPAAGPCQLRDDARDAYGYQHVLAQQLQHKCWITRRMNHVGLVFATWQVWAELTEGKLEKGERKTQVMHTRTCTHTHSQTSAGRSCIPLLNLPFILLRLIQHNHLTITSISNTFSISETLDRWDQHLWATPDFLSSCVLKVKWSDSDRDGGRDDGDINRWTGKSSSISAI